MAIKTYRPTTPTLRFQTTLTNEELTTNRPHKPLTQIKRRTGGRRNGGDITIWHRGGGHKRKLRAIDFKRDKAGVPGTVVSIEYDPNRSARIALIAYADGEKRYIIHPVGLQVGRQIVSGTEAEKLDAHFAREIQPVLTPMAIDPAHPFPHIQNRLRYLIEFVTK